MSNIQLRPYQQQFIDDVRKQFKTSKRVVGVAPCGAGKTIMTGWMIKTALDKGKRSIFFVHRQELIKQTSETFTKLDIPHGIICSGVPMQLDLPVQIASVQTLALRLDKIPAPDFLICDECHHILAATYKKIIDKWNNAFLLGVTATPQRMGGKTLNDVFQRMVLAPSVNQLIKLGNLTKFDYFAAPLNINLDNVRISNGDYNSSDLNKIMVSKKITGDIIKHYHQFADGKSAICYCVNVNHSKSVANSFIEAGISAAHVDGETPDTIRTRLVEDFRLGKIKILCNAELFGEGFDVPACQAVILARPTKSLTLYIQQAMRAMRPDPNAPNKRAVIIDCVQNRERHGLPNTFHEWSLDPNIATPLTCPDCGEKIVPVIFTKKEDVPLSFTLKNGRFFLKDSFDEGGEPVKLMVDYIALTGEPVSVVEDCNGHFMKICPECGFLFPRQEAPDTVPRHEKSRDGELEKIDVSFDAEPKIDSNIIYKPTTIEEFTVTAKKKGYKQGWAAFKALEYVSSYDDCKHIADFCGYKPGWAYYQWQDILAKSAKKNILLPNS